MNTGKIRMALGEAFRHLAESVMAHDEFEEQYPVDADVNDNAVLEFAQRHADYFGDCRTLMLVGEALKELEGK